VLDVELIKRADLKKLPAPELIEVAVPIKRAGSVSESDRT